ncbi:MAG: UPF0176 protein [Pseudohongiellaceae bacterium]|jgi:UPF0176 protein
MFDQNAAPAVVCALYKFVILEDFELIRTPLLNIMLKNEVRGTLLLAREGINGTIAGSRESVDVVLNWLKNDVRFSDIVTKESFDIDIPFNRTKVKLKKEIVTMGVENIDPKKIVGTYVKSKDWNALISDPEVLVVDTRNDYEVKIGTFQNALNPETETFREFPDYVEKNLDSSKHKKVAMFCTGGIRCEKSTAFLKEKGFEEVYHLEGGILKYLEEVPEEETMWKGECFVFDNRVAVNHKLEKGQYDQCNACRMPVTETEKQSEHFIEGVSCPHCYEKKTDAQKARFAERERQVKLANDRGEQHIGGNAADTIVKRKEEKKQERLIQQQQNRSI